MFKILLWDIDGTVLNFKAAEKNALRACFERFEAGICTDEMLERYSKINDRRWKLLEKGELTKPEVLVGRYEEFFKSEGINFDRYEEFNVYYQTALGDTVVFNDDAYTIIEKLKGSFKQYAVTNGTKLAQKKKLENSGLNKLFDGVFISDEIGFEKPSKKFFDYVFESLGECDKDELLIIGDSLTSDILGGNNAGIKCCWYNPLNAEIDKPVRVDYVINNLGEIFDILK